ncbi:protein PHLOEM PROTEIN 2-LIKE A2-like [Elaeis guineensis]|uniref:Protein PHLOEM PROTEIN 2-LIKE A2 n=1 Tax=Elaeis guineensis var. tenera TaxID=51953 RepID=A0A6I9S4F6_ELAGV|nr:protein PHLOEM PROTEIN 2-LIKE A2 [Elaeis guineensis]
MASPHQKGVLDNNFKVSTKDGKTEVITLNTKAITIIWGGESCEGRYWRRTTINSFEVAELVSVYWLEVAGRVPLSNFSPSTTYAFVVTLKLKPEASGWENSPVIFSLKMPGQAVSSKPVKLHQYMGSDWVDVPEGGIRFTVPKSASGELDFAIYEIKGDKWKKGLMIKEVKFIKV